MEGNTMQPAADLSNWRQSPQNHSSFRHLPSEIATARVAAGQVGAAGFTKSAKSIKGFTLRLPNGSVLDLEQFLGATSTDAMVVLRDGELVYETYRNGMEPNSRHITMSATKAVVGLVTEMLAMDGAIELDVPVTKYVPEIADSPFAGATARHLLDMRVGVVFDEAQEKAYARTAGWEPPGSEKMGMQAFFLSLRGPVREHGGPFRYHSANTDLLGWVLERATSRKVQDLLSERLWTQIAVDDGALTLDWAGFARSAGGLCASIGDLARLGRVLSANGRRAQRQIVPSRVVEDLVSGGDRAAWTDGQFAEVFAPISRKMSYRSGWYTVDDDPQVLFALGVHGQNLFIDRANDIVIAKFSSWSQPVDGQALWLTHAAVAEIGRCLSQA
jgi:CubicO group peptidase (beta-lactamase class C family)